MLFSSMTLRPPQYSTARSMMRSTNYKQLRSTLLSTGQKRLPISSNTLCALPTMANAIHRGSGL